jgi:hypothetical protein
MASSPPPSPTSTQRRLSLWISLTSIPLVLTLWTLPRAFFQEVRGVEHPVTTTPSFGRSKNNNNNAIILSEDALASDILELSSSSSSDNEANVDVGLVPSATSTDTRKPRQYGTTDGTVEYYVADPTALQRGRQAYVKSHSYLQGSSDGGNHSSYWATLLDYENHHLVGGGRVWYGDERLTADSICAFGPGQGIEEDSGYKLLTEKIRISEEDDNDDDDPDPVTNNNKTTKTPPRLFCGIYTYSGMRALARAQALSWGYKCDGFVAFSNETLPTLGHVELLHAGDEAYTNMWQKTRSIWAYIYTHYLDDYDYFHLGGDDMYVLVENLKRYLTQFKDDDDDGGGSRPRHIGQWLPDKNMVSGGPGYTLNREAVKRLVEDALPHCEPNKTVAYEDRILSKCLQGIGIFFNETDTRDKETGEQQYHDATPSLLYSFRSSTARRASYQAKVATQWEALPHPSSLHMNMLDHANANKIETTTVLVGPKHELQAAATYSVSFHNLYNPQYVARLHAIVHPRTCPSDSPLGIGLRQHLAF